MVWLANRYSPGLLAGSFKEVIDGLSSLIGQLELDGAPRLLLPHDRAINCITIWSDIFDPQGNDIAAV